MAPIKSEHGVFAAGSSSNGQSSSLGTVVPFLRSASAAVDTILTTKARVMPHEQIPPSPPPLSPYPLIITSNKKNNNNNNNEKSVMRSRTMPVRGPSSNTISNASSLQKGYAITRHTRTNDSETIQKGKDILKSILESRDDVEDVNVVLLEDSSASFSGSSLCKRDENLSSSGRQSDTSGSASSRSQSQLLHTSSTTSSILSFRRRFLEVNQSMDNLSFISNSSASGKKKKNNKTSSSRTLVPHAR